MTSFVIADFGSRLKAAMAVQFAVNVIIYRVILIPINWRNSYMDMLLNADVVQFRVVAIVPFP